MDNLFPCPCCGGVPLTIVEKDMLECVVRIECSSCKMATPSIVFSNGKHAGMGNRLEMGWLPDLQTARSQAGLIWNQRGEATP